MDIRQLRYFMAVADELHFGHAAARLNMAQPPLSQQIRHIESELGIELFQRNKRSVRLTDAGRLFAEEAKATLDRFDETMAAVGRAKLGQAGRIVIGSVANACQEVLPSVLRNYHQRFPRVEIVLRRMPSGDQVRSLATGALHVGFLHPPVHDRTLRSEILHRDPFVVALPVGHPLARMKAVPLRTLADEQFVFYAPASAYYNRVVSACESAGFRPKASHENHDLPTMLALVSAGLGVCIIPGFARQFRARDIEYRALSGPKLELETALAWRSEPAPLVQSFLDSIPR